MESSRSQQPSGCPCWVPHAPAAGRMGVLRQSPGSPLALALPSGLDLRFWALCVASGPGLSLVLIPGVLLTSSLPVAFASSQLSRVWETPGAGEWQPPFLFTEAGGRCVDRPLGCSKGNSGAVGPASHPEAAPWPPCSEVPAVADSLAANPTPSPPDRARQMAGAHWLTGSTCISRFRVSAGVDAGSPGTASVFHPYGLGRSLSDSVKCSVLSVRGIRGN